MTQDEIQTAILQVCKVSGNDSDFNVLGFYALCDRLVELGAAAEREKVQHELLTLEKWKGLALAKDGDGRTVQEVEREAREAEREECAKVCDVLADKHTFEGGYANECAFAIRERGAP